MLETGLANLALNKPACQSSVSEWSRSPLAEEDARGANNGVINGGLGFHTGFERNPWWEVDLQDEYVVHRCAIFNRRDYAERLRHFSLLASLDGRSWTTLFTKRDDAAFGADLAPYEIRLTDARLARFIRVRLNEPGWLHFDEFQVFGERPSAETRAFLLEREASLARDAAAQAGRTGYWTLIDGFEVFVDTTNYHRAIIGALERGLYEIGERDVVRRLLLPGDRVIEAGTAIGVVAMTAAAIVGAESVSTFDGNPAVVADAQANFRRNGMAGIKAHLGVLKNRRSFVAGEAADFYVAGEFVASRLDAAPDDADVVRVERVPVFCLEEEIRAHGANVLICDIEGGEAALLTKAELDPIRMIVMETHYWSAGRAAIDAMMRKLIGKGFSLDLDNSARHLSVLTR